MKLQCSSVNLLGFLMPQSLGCPRIWALDSSLVLPSEVEKKIVWNDLDVIGCLIRLLNVRKNNRMFLKVLQTNLHDSCFPWSCALETNAVNIFVYFECDIWSYIDYFDLLQKNTERYFVLHCTQVFILA